MMPGDLANRISFDGNLIKIDWLKEAHSTVFDAAWLRSHCYSNQERARRRHKPVLWDAGLAGVFLMSAIQPLWKIWEQLLAIYDAVRTYGICLLEDVPKRPEETEKIAGLLSFVRETHYGRVFEIVSTANPAVIANIPVPLRPHTDENFREPPPGIMIFHSIKASEDGGGKSVMTDGFKLAADFKAQYPSEYELLTKVPIPHRRFIEGVGLRAEAPVIGLDYFGHIREFQLNERTMGPLDLPRSCLSLSMMLYLKCSRFLMTASTTCRIC